MQEHETYNTDWWTEKPERADRPSSYAPLGPKTQKPDRDGGGSVWLKSALIVGLMVSFSWALLRLAGQ